MQFYFQNGRPPPNELKERCLFRINQFFYGHTDGLQINGEACYMLYVVVSMTYYLLLHLEHATLCMKVTPNVAQVLNVLPHDFRI